MAPPIGFGRTLFFLHSAPHSPPHPSRRAAWVTTSNQAAAVVNEMKKMMMIDPRRVTVGMQDTFRLRTEEPNIASMRRLDQTMDDILNSHDSPADVMTKYHQALTKYLLLDKKVGQHETIKRTSPPSVESVVRRTPDEPLVWSPIDQPVKLPVESSAQRSQSAEPSPRHRSQSRRSQQARPKRKRAPKHVYPGNWSNY